MLALYYRWNVRKVWTICSNLLTNMAQREFNPDKELSHMCTKLWTLDVNRLVPGKDYNLDLQGETKVYKREDKAKDPLFLNVNEDKLKKLPTFKAFIALLDNYATETGVPEEVTPQEEKENRHFLEEIMKTKVMKKCHEYLVKKQLASNDVSQFKQQLYDLWFKLYRRTRGMREADSSGFEHVFVGECRGGTDEVIGFHNWIQYYLEEKRGNVDYQGWIRPRGKKSRSSATDSHSQLISIQFTWKSDTKPVGSSFIGTSPEFEVALYTLVFFAGQHGKNYISVADYDIELVVHKMGDKLGSSYPVSLHKE
ncbi:poly(U)-specific endoribonuclease-B-like isoform X1 [Apostichopus japonicus]|uniref:poly(U)-specific endoribonuclease-B-like isoform X1 n=2 Tax=Stichopus japonicus TaxID=307972 RepID=UPI003AB8963B